MNIFDFIFELALILLILGLSGIIMFSIFMYWLFKLLKDE